MNPNRFRFIHEYPELPEEFRIEVSLSADVTVDEVVQAFKQFLLAVGYHPDSVQEVLG